MASLKCNRSSSRICSVTRLQSRGLRRSDRVVRRAKHDEQGPNVEANATVAVIRDSVEMFFQRYDVLSAMMGSMLVTTLAVMHGQSLSTAAGLTVVSTVMALVANEVLFDD